MDSPLSTTTNLLFLPLFFALIYEFFSLGIFRSLFGFLRNPLFD